MRWVIAALLSLAPVIALAAECNGAPKPGTDDAGNFRFLRAIAERSPGFAVLKEQKAPISCSYEFGPLTGTITYESDAVRLRITRHFGGCTERRIVELETPPVPEAKALDLVRREIQFYGPGFEQGLDEKLLMRFSAADGSVRISSHDLLKLMGADLIAMNGSVGRFRYFVSIGCED